MNRSIKSILTTNQLYGIRYRQTIFRRLILARQKFTKPFSFTSKYANIVQLKKELKQFTSSTES